jgi:beta-glucosidase
MKTKVWTKASFSPKETERERAHRALARDIAAESIVLLKNNDVLPLKPCKVSLYGAGAGETIKSGTGSGEVNSRTNVSIAAGLKNSGFTVTTGAWLDHYSALLKKEKAEFYVAFNKRTQKAALGGDDFRINIMSESFHYPAGDIISESDIKGSDTDTCVYVVTRQAGECSDRKLNNFEYTLEPILRREKKCAFHAGCWLLTHENTERFLEDVFVCEYNEIENIRICASRYKKTVLVINIGGSIDLCPLDGIDGIDALVFFGQQGMEGGSAFAIL